MKKTFVSVLLAGTALACVSGAAKASGIGIGGCTSYCEVSLTGTAPATPPTPQNTYTLSPGTDQIVDYNVGDVNEFIFTLGSGSGNGVYLNIGVNQPDYLVLDSYGPTTGQGTVHAPGGWVQFLGSGTYDVYLTLNAPVVFAALDPPIGVEITNDVPLSNPPSTTPVPPALPLMGSVLGAAFLVSMWRRKRPAKHLAIAAAA